LHAVPIQGNILMQFWLRRRVFTDVTFWYSAEYGILCGSGFNTAEFRGIFYCLIMRYSVYGISVIKYTGNSHFFRNKTEVKF
jgi:hypothetical protein